MNDSRKTDLGFAVVAFAATVAGFYFAASESVRQAHSDRLEGVGWVDVYRRERIASLFRLLESARRIPDPEVRDREAGVIQAQIDRLQRGEREEHEEFGEELTVERFGN